MLITKIGNLVLFDHKNATVWQSFDHPTDTLVLGQSLQEGTRLIASTSATNMTQNQLYITVLPHGLCAYAESAPPQPYYCSPSVPNNKKGNVTFVNGSLVRSDFSDISQLPPAKSTQYMRLDSDGHMRLYEYEWSMEKWTVEYDILQIDDCAYPTVCGEYGICTQGQCACPLQNYSSSSYFKPVDERKPNLGCTPITPISCQEIQHHSLLTLTDISYFDKSHDIVNLSEDDCKQACLKNCSCRAVMYSYDRLGPGRCTWMTKVFSLQAMQPVGNLSSSTYLKVQLNPSISASSSNKIRYISNRKKVMVGATLGAITALALLVIVVILYLRRRNKYEDKDEEFDFNRLPGKLRRFSLETLRECTEGFNKKLGEGGFGSVFEGKLGEQRVAVKRLEGARQGKKEFLAEVETIGSIEHINLVSLVGFCAEKLERLLVYEYMSRGSLDRWIYYRHNNPSLDWCTRCRIILDIAKGLCYLHEECKRKIVHLDIKPQNILLDDNFNAKVADFGLCKLINRDQSKVVTVMRGTPGYLAPEWLTSQITEKVDVYSFGVVVMEIVSGRKNIDHSRLEEEVQLINVLREKAQNDQLVDLIDKHSDDMVSRQEEVIQMMKLAIWCLQNDSIRRPSMSIVIKVLEGSMSVETIDANSVMLVQHNASTYSIPPQASVLSGPR
ncbi:G-type lectin S-receptor-like serine/threonine-protein kinase SD2-5 isoform X2 [Triticum urartu]|nr:G-type lectin S-receptor-like serine/threonine-protein kinase SD2-5 isoform X2 [Triticum urartu]